jgi:hypothetical protein
MKNYYFRKITKIFHSTQSRLIIMISFTSLFFLATLAVSPASPAADDQTQKEIGTMENHPPELLKLAEEFREMRGRYSRRWHPGWGDGILDYASLVKKQKALLPVYRRRLDSFDINDWSVHNKIDYLILRSEMDQLEWELYVIRQWSRNPGFYVDLAINNVSRHLTGGRVMGERPNLMPYSKEQAEKILRALQDTGKILDQGRKNLSEIVPELAAVVLTQPSAGWPLPSMENGQLKHIVEHYNKWAEATALYFPASEAPKLLPAAQQAGEQLMKFGTWLEENRKKMKGKFFIGKELVNWYLRHIFLMPYSSDQILLLAESERARAISYLQFELHKNRYLPPIGPAKTTKEYLAWDDETVLAIRRWYLENGEDILSDQDYQPLIRSEESVYLPPFGMLAFPFKEKPGVSRVLIPPADHWSAIHSNYGWYTDPGVLQGHEYWPGHTYERNIHRHHPCPIRRGHVDSGHSEGWCFYNEELLVALDFPFVRGPRSRELVYINMLQRAERILIGLPLLAGEITPEEAYRAFQEHLPPLGSGMGITPEEAYMEVYKRIVWRGNDCFDAQTGKLQLLKLLADYKIKQREKFRLKEFHNQYLKFGQIPISLLRWELLGDDKEAKIFFDPVRLSTILNSYETKPK